MELCIQNNSYLEIVHASGQSSSSWFGYIRNEVWKQVTTFNVCQNKRHSPCVQPITMLFINTSQSSFREPLNSLVLFKLTQAEKIKQALYNISLVEVSLTFHFSGPNSNFVLRQTKRSWGRCKKNVHCISARHQVLQVSPGLHSG